MLRIAGSPTLCLVPPFIRDGTGHVTRIDTVASAGCKRYCTGNFGLSDNFLPASNWAAGNQ